MKQQPVVSNIRLEKFVHGGQAIAHLPDGKTVFVWGGLPGELVSIRLLKQKKSHAEGVVVDVLEASSERILAVEPTVYLSTSPWQIVSWEAENRAKQAILEETFTHAGLTPAWERFVYAADQSTVLHYRNKMEFGFFGDDDGLHLAHYVRGSHGKQITNGSALAEEPINQAAQAIVQELNRLKVWGGDLKTVVLRCSQQGETVAALFIKNESLDLSDFEVPNMLKGMDIYFSNPKSPASVPTKLLHRYGATELCDELMGKKLHYSVLSFFQVNLPIFNQALKRIDFAVGTLSKIDLYSGVGSIGVALDGTDVLVESDADNIRMARKNTAQLDSSIQVVHAASEKVLDYIDGEHAVIVDPPRAGMHEALIACLLEKRPPKIAYLSCNPATQARDVALLHESYRITRAEGFNFFPRTPHIESLILLERR